MFLPDMLQASSACWRRYAPTWLHIPVEQVMGVELRQRPEHCAHVACDLQGHGNAHIQLLRYCAGRTAVHLQGSRHLRTSNSSHRAFRVVLFAYPVPQLPALAQLGQDVHRVIILKCCLERSHVQRAAEAPHCVQLPAQGLLVACPLEV